MIMRLLAISLLVAAGACFGTRVNVAPVKVEPIHMTIDVNLHDGTAPSKPPGNRNPD